MRITILGARGFVGSAFVRYLRLSGLGDVCEVTRENYLEFVGIESDVVIDAAGNSKKFLAERDVLKDFELSVTHCLRSLVDFPSKLRVHISSVDVYSDLTRLSSTMETSRVDIRRCSHYGLHKLLAEEIVQHHAKRWLILRLAGMVGEGLRKNPIFDILNGTPLHIHAESRYQYMATDDVARIGMMLVSRGFEGEIFNLCGDGLISPRQIAEIAGCKLTLSEDSLLSEPRIVDVNIDKVKDVAPIPRTASSVTDFINAWKRA